jgi:predicted PurR-regulated permease PerM
LAIVLLTLTSLTGGALYWGGRAVAQQFAELAQEMPRSLGKLREQLQQSEWGTWLIQQSPDSAEQLPVSSEEVTSFISSAASSLGNGLLAILIVLFVALYLAIDPHTYAAGLVRLFPVDKRPRAREVFGEVEQTLEWWLVGKFLSMFVVAVLTYVGLLLIGVPLALALTVIAGLLTFVPNFGPILSALPAILLAFVSSPMTAAYVALLYLAVQTVESYLITPLIQQRTVSLPPALTIVAQVAMGVLLGAGGVILATPLTAAALVIVRRVYIQDTLESSVQE